MTVKFLRDHLNQVSVAPQKAGQEKNTLPKILDHAELLLKQLLLNRNVPTRWNGKELYVLPIGVRSIKEDCMIELLLEPNLGNDSLHGRWMSPAQQKYLIRPYFLILSENTIHDWDAHRQVKNKQFYLQTAISYGIGKLVPYSELVDVLKAFADDLIHELHKISPEGGSNIYLYRGTSPAVWQEFPEDLDRVFRTLRGGLDSLFRIHDDKVRDEAYAEFTLDVLAKPAPKLTLEFDKRRRLLTDLAAVYHVGRYRRAGFHAAIHLRWLHHEPGSSSLLKKLRDQLIEGFRKDTISGNKRINTETDNQPTLTYGRLRAYYLFRDCARTLASGAARWPARAADGRRKILLIDDNYRADVNWRLDVIRRELWDGNVTIDVAVPAVWAEFSTWFETNWASQVRTWEPTKSLCVRRMPTYPPGRDDGRDQSSPAKTKALVLVDYDLILLDAEVEGRDRGPELVFWLDQVAKAQARLAESGKLTREEQQNNARSAGDISHRIIVLTDARPTENMQQSFNLGVENYIFKDRIFDLPFAITQVHEVKQLRQQKGSSRDYRAIHQLPLRALSYLLSTEPSLLISGSTSNYHERRWIKQLPKADLHYHIGTSISLESIAAMSLNTTGYLLNRNEDRSLLKRAVQDCCDLLLDTLANASDAKSIHAAFWQAAWDNFSGPMKKHQLPARDSPPDSDIFGKVIAAMTGEGVIRHFEYASLLVAAIVIFEHKVTNPKSTLPNVVDERWCWVEDLGKHRKKRKDNQLTDAAFNLGARLWRSIQSAVKDWTGVYVKNEVLATFDDAGYDDDTWIRVHSKVKRRLDLSSKVVSSTLEKLHKSNPDRYKKACDYGAGRRTGIFHHFVAAAEESDESQVRGLLEIKSLLRYLWGSSLLGADHLQFPENILLAALDIVKQNVDDNVWYSELRCATNGYCQAGLRPLAATEILCRSFDVASAHWAAAYNNRWVLVNILLGAKRHKPAEIPEVVRLLTSFLQRNREQHADRVELRGKNSPSWWSLSRVVGFDLSGNESRIGESALKTNDLRRDMLPLLEDCTQITIHAGEASTAENIWDAIYLLGARRIGHGLRLREHQRLLDHAVTQGICLELCPISNSLTNDFATNLRRRNGGETKTGGGPDEGTPSASSNYDPNSRWHYPLGGYLAKDVHVCINTDNRFLHDEHTLTDEYLKAAQLVGGLTRLEILRLMRAGFSTAFLETQQKKEMLGSVEEVVYRILCEHDEEIYGPNGS